MTHRAIEQQVHSFDAVDQVIANEAKFKIKLGIGADAYASLRAGKFLQQLWDVGGVAATGAGAAASTTVASTFFGSIWTTVGLASAATPLGWVLGAAAATGGVYYGVTRLFHGYSESRVDVVPKFINTPIDLLAASLLDLLGSLAVKVAAMDGVIDAKEKLAMQSYFVEEWGYDPVYSANAFDLLIENEDKARLKEMTASLAEFVHANPDCKFAAIQKEVSALLEEIATADGTIDEREEMAIERIVASLREQNSMISSVKRTAAAPVAGVSNTAGWLARKVGLGKQDE